MDTKETAEETINRLWDDAYSLIGQLTKPIFANVFMQGINWKSKREEGPFTREDMERAWDHGYDREGGIVGKGETIYDAKAFNEFMEANYPEKLQPPFIPQGNTNALVFPTPSQFWGIIPVRYIEEITPLQKAMKVIHELKRRAERNYYIGFAIGTGCLALGFIIWATINYSK